jgi:hypothetical protein
MDIEVENQDPLGMMLLLQHRASHGQIVDHGVPIWREDTRGNSP